MLVICGSEPPPIVLLSECVEHMVDSKKDAQLTLKNLNQSKVKIGMYYGNPFNWEYI